MTASKKDEIIVLQNLVAKHAGINRAATFVDKKKQQRTPRKLKNNKIDL
ncbi:MAG: DUF7230 family protein [Aeromonas veronii]